MNSTSGNYKKVIEYISNHFQSEDCIASTICIELDISRSTLHRIVKAHSGQSTTNYINNLRLARGLMLLQQGGIKIKEVTLTVGFTDAKYFSRLFKRKYGISPTEFLKSLRVKTTTEKNA